MNHVVLEGFVDKHSEGDQFFMFLLQPCAHYHGDGSLSIDGMIDDVLIDMSTGFPPRDESEKWDMAQVNRVFERAKAAYTTGKQCRYAYFKVEADVIEPDEEPSPDVYRITSFEAPKNLQHGGCFEMYLASRGQQG